MIKDEWGMKMNRRIIASGLALFMAAASFSCGKTDPQAETELTETTTEAVTETTAIAEDGAEVTTTKKKSSGSGLGFGMMGYVKKSHLVSARCNAKTLYNAFTTYNKF